MLPSDRAQLLHQLAQTDHVIKTVLQDSCRDTTVKEVELGELGALTQGRQENTELGVPHLIILQFQSPLEWL